MKDKELEALALPLVGKHIKVVAFPEVPGDDAPAFQRVTVDGKVAYRVSGVLEAVRPAWVDTLPTATYTEAALIIPFDGDPVHFFGVDARIKIIVPASLVVSIDRCDSGTCFVCHPMCPKTKIYPEGVTVRCAHRIEDHDGPHEWIL